MAKSSRNIRKKRPGPARPAEILGRPIPLKFAGRNGPARPGPICQAWDLQPCWTEPV